MAFKPRISDCEQCGERFEDWEWRSGKRRQRFCSKRCSLKGHKNSPCLIKKMLDGVQRAREIRGGQNWNAKGKDAPGYLHGKTSEPAYVNWQKNLRNHRIRANGGNHSFGEWQNLKAQYDWTCPACNKSEPEIKLTEDHIVPLSKGGSHNIENIQPLCMNCNQKKSTKIIKY